MGSWRKTLGLLAGGLASLGGFATSAFAQFPGPGGGMMPPPGMMPSSSGMMPPPGMLTGGGPPPGAFTGNPNLGGMPPDFPNAAVPSKEPASPFSIKDEGLPNAFTELIDPRPRVAVPHNIAFRAEYLGWWFSAAGSNVNLVTTNANFPAEIGALGQPSTQVLVASGSNAIDYKMIQGGRATLAMTLGFLPPIEITGFDFNRNLKVFEEGSTDGSGRFIARPVQLINGLDVADVINVPGILNGQVSVMSRFSIWNVDANMLFNFFDGRSLRTDLILGYRHTDLYESLEITNNSGGSTGQIIFNGAVQAPGVSVFVRDVFRSRSAFDGGQFGLRNILTFDQLSLFTDIKLAMGVTNHTLTIDGTSTGFSPAGAAQPINGGLLALGSNRGSSSIQHFTLIPEANVSLSYQFNRNLRVFGGYNILYWSRVIRPGDHVNSVIDPAGVPTAVGFTPGVGTAPGFPAIVTRDFWAHGFSVGIEIGF